MESMKGFFGISQRLYAPNAEVAVSPIPNEEAAGFDIAHQSLKGLEKQKITDAQKSLETALGHLNAMSEPTRSSDKWKNLSQLILGIQQALKAVQERNPNQADGIDVIEIDALLRTNVEGVSKLNELLTQRTDLIANTSKILETALKQTSAPASTESMDKQKSPEYPVLQKEMKELLSGNEVLYDALLAFMANVTAKAKEYKHNDAALAPLVKMMKDLGNGLKDKIIVDQKVPQNAVPAQSASWFINTYEGQKLSSSPETPRPSPRSADALAMVRHNTAFVILQQSNKSADKVTESGTYLSQTNDTVQTKFDNMTSDEVQRTVHKQHERQYFEFFTLLAKYQQLQTNPAKQAEAVQVRQEALQIVQRAQEFQQGQVKTDGTRKPWSHALTIGNDSYNYPFDAGLIKKYTEVMETAKTDLVATGPQEQSQKAPENKERPVTGYMDAFRKALEGDTTYGRIYRIKGVDKSKADNLPSDQTNKKLKYEDILTAYANDNMPGLDYGSTLSLTDEAGSRLNDVSSMPEALKPLVAANKTIDLTGRDYQEHSISQVAERFVAAGCTPVVNGEYITGFRIPGKNVVIQFTRRAGNMAVDMVAGQKDSTAMNQALTPEQFVAWKNNPESYKQALQGTLGIPKPTAVYFQDTKDDGSEYRRMVTFFASNVEAPRAAAAETTEVSREVDAQITALKATKSLQDFKKLFEERGGMAEAKQQDLIALYNKMRKDTQFYVYKKDNTDVSMKWKEGAFVTVGAKLLELARQNDTQLPQDVLQSIKDHYYIAKSIKEIPLERNLVEQMEQDLKAVSSSPVTEKNNPPSTRGTQNPLPNEAIQQNNPDRNLTA